MPHLYAKALLLSRTSCCFRARSGQAWGLLAWRAATCLPSKAMSKQSSVHTNDTMRARGLNMSARTQCQGLLAGVACLSFRPEMWGRDREKPVGRGVVGEKARRCAFTLFAGARHAVRLSACGSCLTPVRSALPTAMGSATALGRRRRAAHGWNVSRRRGLAGGMAARVSAQRNRASLGVVAYPRVYRAEPMRRSRPRGLLSLLGWN